MSIQYRLKKDLTGRAATQLNYNLNGLKSSVSLIRDVVINAKSLVGILSGGFKQGEVITVLFDRDNESEAICEYFNEVGEKLMTEG